MTEEEARQFDNVCRHLAELQERQATMETQMWVSDRMMEFMWRMGCTGIGARGDREALKCIVEQAGFRAHTAVGRLVTAALTFASATTDEAQDRALAGLRTVALELAASNTDGVLAPAPQEPDGRV